MFYIKVDDNGNIIRPVHVTPLQIPGKNIFLVDTDSKSPKNLKWDKVRSAKEIVKEGDRYYMTYDVIDAAEPGSDKKKELFKKYFMKQRSLNISFFEHGAITQEQFEQNTYILDNVNFDDESTYSMLEKMEFKMLAKIDSDGKVIEFPYVKPLNSDEDNTVVVDTYKFKPEKEKIKWYQAIFYDTVEKVEDSYCVKYTIDKKKFTSDEEKAKTFEFFVNDAKKTNQAKYENGEITEEQYTANLNILNAIVLTDENCYDDIYKLSF